MLPKCLICSLAVLGLVLSGCGDKTRELHEGESPVAATRKSGQDSSTSSEPTPPATEFVTVTDPVENAYSLDMPKGWYNRAYLARDMDVASQVDTTVSPNGTVLTFNGDPSLPQYWNPDGASEVLYQIAKVNRKTKIEYYVPAEQYFPDYVERKFGKLPDFQIVSAEADVEATQKLQQRFTEAGLNAQASMARVKFTYTDDGKKMNALIMGSSTNSGSMWIVTVCGISTTGTPENYIPMLEAMEKTRRTNPQWQQEQQAKHQQRMDQMAEFGRQMTAQHERNMAWIQQSASAHQARMQAIWASNDASIQSFNERMASGDLQQRRFLNYINDENTVETSSGKAYQVDNSYQRYYVNKSTGKYIGGDITMDQDKLRSFGLNPDDYEEAKIRQ